MCAVSELFSTYLSSEGKGNDSLSVNQGTDTTVLSLRVGRGSPLTLNGVVQDNAGGKDKGQTRKIKLTQVLTKRERESQITQCQKNTRILLCPFCGHGIFRFTTESTLLRPASPMSLAIRMKDGKIGRNPLYVNSASK